MELLKEFADTEPGASPNTTNRHRITPALSRALRRPPFFWLTIVLGMAISCAYFFSFRILLRYSPGETSFGWTSQQRDGQCVVTDVDATGPARQKLEPGDRILAFDGDQRVAGVGPQVYEYFLGGSSYSLRIQRNSHQEDVSLATRRSPISRTLAQALYLILGLSFLGVAVMLGLLNSEDRVAQLGSVTCFAVALRIIWLGMWPYEDIATSFEKAVIQITELPDPWQMIFGFFFFYRFSADLLHERFWRALRLFVCAAGLILFLPNAIVRLFNVLGRDAALNFAFGYPSIVAIQTSLYKAFRMPYEVFVLLAMCAALAASYARVRDTDHRRRVRWIVFGSVFALTPLLAYQVLDLVVKAAGLGDLNREWPGGLLIANLCLVIIPFAISYAILKHRALGISVVIRLSMKYLLARNVLQIILLLPVIALLLPLLQNPNRTVAQLFLQHSIYLNLVLLAVLSVGLKYRHSVRTWIDRKFFREAYNQEKILRELIGSIKELDSSGDISRLVSLQVESALHPTSFSIFYRENENSDLTVSYTTESSTPGLRISENWRIVKLLEASEHPLDYPLPRGVDIPTAEKQWLERLATHLIVPITSGRPRIAGVLLLGPKMSEEPYTPSDRNLLEAIAAQMGIVHERDWLKRQVGEEQRIKREVLAHLAHTDINLLKECPQCGTCFDSKISVCDHDGAELSMTLPVERSIDQKYRLERRIGKGGMGAVYEATDLRLNRKIALKVMTGNLFGNREALRRFEREARASARLSHPNIVAIYDFGLIGQDGAYLVMERIYGCTWRNELEQRGLITPLVAADWFSQLITGLRAAHQAGVVHRDLKPENVLLTPLGADAKLIKMLDFGVAKLRQFNASDTQSITIAGTLVGTMGYMSPEQFAGTESDERSDVFSVGVMLVEALTGSRPFEGRTYAELAASMLKQPRLLSSDAPGVVQLNAVLAKFLAKDPADRFSTSVEAQNVLVAALRACPPVATADGQSA